MIFQNGEITISPYSVYWVQMPVIIGEADRVELLKRNVFVIECQYELDDYGMLIDKKDDMSAFFFNLDRMFQGIEKGREYENALRIAKFISNFCPDRSVIHTTIIDEKMKTIFVSEGLIYLERNFNDKEGAVVILMNLLKPLFSSENRIQRTDIRLLLYPKTMYKIEAITNNGLKVVTGYLKDISLSGIGIKFEDVNDLDNFSLRDQITIRMITHNAIFKIPLGIVSRKTTHVKEVGVSFVITDTNMIREETANFIVKLIYKWIKDVIVSQGKIL